MVKGGKMLIVYVEYRNIRHNIYPLVLLMMSSMLEAGHHFRETKLNKKFGAVV